MTSLVLFVFLFSAVPIPGASYNFVYAKSSAGGSFKSGSFSSPKSSSSTYKSGSFSNTKQSTTNANTKQSNSGTNTYSSNTKRSFLPIPIFMPWGHGIFGFGSSLISILALVILIILIIFIVRLFKKYKRRR